MLSFFSLFAGLEVTPTLFRIALLKKSKKGISIHSLKEIPRSNSVNPLDFLPKEAYLTTAAPSREVLLRQLKLPLTRAKEIESAVLFQAESLLPYPMEKTLLSYEVTEKKKEGSSLSLFALKKEHLAAHLEKLKEVGIDPDQVTAAPIALASLFTLYSKSDAPHLFIHLNEEEACVALVKEGHVASARASSLDPFEIQKTILSIEKNAKLPEPLTSIILLSDKSKEPLIREASQKNVLTPSLLSLNLSPEEMTKFSFAIGIALAGLLRSPVNFRTSEFLPSFPWHRWMRPLILSSCLALAAAASLFFIERQALKNQENSLLEKIPPLAALVEIKKELPRDSSSLPSFLSDVDKELAKRPDLFPLLPLIPKASDLLAWLSTLPSSNEASVRIEEFNYLITQRPDFTNKEQPYLAKVELLLTTSSPATCQEWLKSKNPFIDPKLELEWHKEGEGSFRASFVLKDKTRYNP